MRSCLSQRPRVWCPSLAILVAIWGTTVFVFEDHLCVLYAQEAAKPIWTYTPELLRPFWQGDAIEGESVLFIKDSSGDQAKASVLFPIREVLSVRNSGGDVLYENGRDFVWNSDSREIVLPAGSRIPFRLPEELRRPAKSQKHGLFAQYRDALQELLQPGVALADLTSIWTGFLELKKDSDQTGNGVNHPNDPERIQS